MQKTIRLNADLNDPFFVELQNKLINMRGFEEYMPTIISQVMNATLKTFKQLSSPQASKKICQFAYEQTKHAYPEYHNILDNNIDIALNRRIHTSTLERITDIIEKFTNEYANKQKEENKIKFLPLVDSEKELEAITNYISNTWNGFSDESSTEFFRKVWDLSNHMLKNHFDYYSLFDFRKKLQEIEELPTFTINGVSNKHISSYFLVTGHALQDVIKQEWDYEKNVKSILSEVKSEFPSASKAKPKNWLKMAKNYCDYDGMDELDSEALHKLFGGMNSGTAGAPSFEIRTALPHVIYDDICQGRKSLETLVGAILGHAYVMNERNNGIKLLKEFIALTVHIEANPGQDITFEFKEPLAQAFVATIQNQGTVEQSTLSLLGLSKRKNKPKM